MRSPESVQFPVSLKDLVGVEPPPPIYRMDRPFLREGPPEEPVFTKKRELLDYAEGKVPFARKPGRAFIDRDALDVSAKGAQAKEKIEIRGVATEADGENVQVVAYFAGDQIRNRVVGQGIVKPGLRGDLETRYVLKSVSLQPADEAVPEQNTSSQEKIAV